MKIRLLTLLGLALAGCGAGDSAGEVTLLESAPVCGNGIREIGEQCDDGNKVSLDGCDVGCRLEQVQRANSLKLQFGADATCAVNALGGAIVNDLARGQFQTSIDTGVKNGSVTVLLQALGLADLSGAGDSPVSLGVVSGAPVTGTGYDGTKDLDWWYTVAPTTIDAMRRPLAIVSGQLRAQKLTAGPGAITMNLVIGGSPAELHLTNALLAATLGAASAPLASTGATPGHLASEQLDPALVSFASTSAGTLCGNIGAASLANVKLASAVTKTCTQYDLTNSALDLFVGGCSTAFGLITVVNPTQPDQLDPAAPLAGAGAPYTFTVDATRHVNGCSDKAGTSVALDACLKSGAYSSYFKFTTDRVIVH